MYQEGAGTSTSTVILIRKNSIKILQNNLWQFPHEQDDNAPVHRSPGQFTTILHRK